MISLRPTLLAAAMAAIALPAAVQAEDTALTPVASASGIDPCISQTANETEARACLDEQVAWAWDELGKSWFAALAAVGGTGTPAGKALVAEKDAWMQYQAAACRFYTVERNGLVEYGLTQRCQQMLISARAADLDFNVSKIPADLRHGS